MTMSAKSLRAVKLFFLLKEKEGVKNEKKDNDNDNDVLCLSAKEKLTQVIITRSCQQKEDYDNICSLQ